jgi:hypothetical protein
MTKREKQTKFMQRPMYEEEETCDDEVRKIRSAWTQQQEMGNRKNRHTYKSRMAGPRGIATTAEKGKNDVVASAPKCQRCLSFGHQHQQANFV